MRVHKRKVEALQGGSLCLGAIIPNGWATRLEQEAVDTRQTRAAVARGLVAAWLKKHPQFNDVQHAADVNNRSYGQQLRQIFEDEAPHLCPPIAEYRGDGARHSRAVREGRAKHKMAPTVTVKLPGYVEAYLRKLAKDKPDVYPTHEDVLVRLATRWVEAQIAKTETVKT